MRKITSSDILNEKISELECLHEFELNELKLSLERNYNNLQPSNIIKRTYHELKEDKLFKEELLGTGINILIGEITNKIFVGNSTNKIRQTLGRVLELAVVKIVSKNNVEIQEAASGLIQSIFKPDIESEEESTPE
jgi:hypothetical protein